MGALKDNVKKSIMHGIRNGGKISDGEFEGHLSNGLNKILNDSLALTIPIYQSLEAGREYYEIGSAIPSSSELTTIRPLAVFRVVKNADGHVTERVALRYSLSQKQDGTSGYKWYIRLASTPTENGSSNMEVLCAVTTGDDVLIPDHMTFAVQEALEAYVMYRLLGDAGKPWGAPDLASHHLSRYNQAVAVIKISSQRNFNYGFTKMNSQQSFI